MCSVYPNRRRAAVLVLGILLLAAWAMAGLPASTPTQATTLRQAEDFPDYHRIEHPHWPNALKVPVGFTVDEVASNLRTPRFMALDDAGNLYFGSYTAYSVVRLLDQDMNGSYDVQQTVATGLSVVHSVAFFQGQLYAAAQDRVVRLTDLAPNGWAQRQEAIITGIPSVAEINGTIDATQMDTFASGLRNTVGFAIHPATGDVWGLDMGRDNLGPDLPPEELNLLRDNHNYGWPYCYGNRQPNPEYGDPALCADTTPPQFVFPAHWAPLGIDFYDQAAFPGYRNDALVAFHGSSPSQTNNTRQGARVVRVRFEQGRPVGYHDLLRGFEIGNRTWARPAGVLVAPDGSVLVSDDYGGRIFRIRYVGETP